MSLGGLVGLGVVVLCLLGLGHDYGETDFWRIKDPILRTLRGTLLAILVAFVLIGGGLLVAVLIRMLGLPPLTPLIGILIAAAIIGAARR